MGNQHVIELNGKRYDALTGKIIATNPVSTPAKTKPVTTAKVASIDGFSRKKHSVAAVTKRQTNQAAAHKAEKSKTLMRTTVAKPKATTNPSVAALKPQPISHDTAAVSQKRLAHAKSVTKSPVISRFSVAKDSIAHKASQATNSVKHVTKAASKPSAATAAVAPAMTSKSLVDKALAEAQTPDNHRLKKEKRSARIGRKLHLTSRQVSFGGFAVALILITGFFAYQNATNISMRIASSRAGVHGNLPGYQPAGFGIAGGVAYNPGQITIAYKSTSDNRNFKIMQNVSEWNSQALLDNFVATNHPNNQTIQDRGKTIYIYDGSNATWVDGGIWYRIEGDSQLNSDQLLRIAASL